MVGPPGLEWGCWVTRCFLHVVVIGPLEHFWVPCGSPSLVLESAGVPHLFLVAHASTWDQYGQLAALPVGTVVCNWRLVGDYPSIPVPASVFSPHMCLWGNPVCSCSGGPGTPIIVRFYRITEQGLIFTWSGAYFWLQTILITVPLGWFLALDYVLWQLYHLEGVSWVS